MASVPDLVHHYNHLESIAYEQSELSLLSSSKHLPHIDLDEFHLELSSIMFDHSRSSSQTSSIKTDNASLSTSPPTSTYESPTSLHSSPTFSTTDSFKYQSTGTSHRMNSLPQFSMANMHGLMGSQTRAQTHRPQTRSKRWLPRRTLSQTVMDMQSELQAGGIESAGLGLFEPRPMETTISRQSTQSSVVLDGIFEVMHGR